MRIHCRLSRARALVLLSASRLPLITFELAGTRAGSPRVDAERVSACIEPDVDGSISVQTRRKCEMTMRLAAS